MVFFYLTSSVLILVLGVAGALAAGRRWGRLVGIPIVMLVAEGYFWLFMLASNHLVGDTSGFRLGPHSWFSI